MKSSNILLSAVLALVAFCIHEIKGSDFAKELFETGFTVRPGSEDVPMQEQETTDPFSRTSLQYDESEPRSRLLGTDSILHYSEASPTWPNIQIDSTRQQDYNSKVLMRGTIRSIPNTFSTDKIIETANEYIRSNRSVENLDLLKEALLKDPKQRLDKSIIKYEIYNPIINYDVFSLPSEEIIQELKKTIYEDNLQYNIQKLCLTLRNVISHIRPTSGIMTKYYLQDAQLFSDMLIQSRQLKTTSIGGVLSKEMTTLSITNDTEYAVQNNINTKIDSILDLLCRNNTRKIYSLLQTIMLQIEPSKNKMQTSLQDAQNLIDILIEYRAATGFSTFVKRTDQVLASIKDLLSKEIEKLSKTSNEKPKTRSYITVTINLLLKCLCEEKNSAIMDYILEQKLTPPFEKKLLQILRSFVKEKNPQDKDNIRDFTNIRKRIERLQLAIESSTKKQKLSEQLKTQEETLKAFSKKPTLEWLQQQENLLQQYITILESQEGKSSGKQLETYKQQLKKAQDAILFITSQQEVQEQGRNHPSTEQLKKYKASLETRENIKPKQERQELIDLLEKKIEIKEKKEEFLQTINNKKEEIEKEVEQNGINFLLLDNNYTKFPDVLSLASIEVVLKWLAPIITSQEGKPLYSALISWSTTLNSLYQQGVDGKASEQEKVLLLEVIDSIGKLKHSLFLAPQAIASPEPAIAPVSTPLTPTIRPVKSILTPDEQQPQSTKDLDATALVQSITPQQAAEEDVNLEKLSSEPEAAPAPETPSTPLRTFLSYINAPINFVINIFSGIGTTIGSWFNWLIGK